jgi:hypothetical protein
MHDFGNVYQAVKTPMGNGSPPVLVAHGRGPRKAVGRSSRARSSTTPKRDWDEIRAAPRAARMDRPDAQLIADEVRNGAAMLASPVITAAADSAAIR